MQCFVNIVITSKKMTIDLTREEMLERLIEAQYDGMDYKALYHYFEYYQQLEFKDWTTEEIQKEYTEYFPIEE